MGVLAAVRRGPRRFCRRLLFGGAFGRDWERLYFCLRGYSELWFRVGPCQACVPSLSISLLGASISLSEDFASASLPENRRGDLIKELGGILALNRLTPGLAAKIRGELGLAQLMMVGIFGRAQLQPFANLQYHRAIYGNRKLSRELSDVIPWWIEALRGAAPRKIPMRAPRPILLCTDAAGRGHLGVVVLTLGPRENFPLTYPRVGGGRGI